LGADTAKIGGRYFKDFWHHSGIETRSLESTAQTQDFQMAIVNPLTAGLNPSAQRCLTRFFTRDFAS
jgi:hypothetical protein